jgi:peptidoglycan/LPS O-acetylase OafA/YrhL
LASTLSATILTSKGWVSSVQDVQLRVLGATETLSLPASHRQPLPYWPQLDALRFFAFLAVFVHHSFPQDTLFYVNRGIPMGVAEWMSAFVRAGGFGVDLFFVLSSFLITSLLIREVQAHGTISVRKFYLRRILRIWPLYYAFLALAIFVFPYLGLEGEFIEPKFVPAFVFFFGNWAVTWWGYPASSIALLWSLSIEEQFYVVWPVLLKILGKDGILKVSIACVLIALFTRIFLAYLEVKHPAIWCNTLARLDTIGAGGILAVLFEKNKEMFRFAKWQYLLAIFVSIFVLGACARFWAFDGISSVFGYLIVAFAASVALISFFFLRFPNIFVFLGRISFGLYVYHIFAIHLAKRFVNVQPIQPVAAFVVTVIISVASYFLFEQHWLKLKQKFAFSNPAQRV